jgi:DNA polymerase sigma
MTQTIAEEVTKIVGARKDLGNIAVVALACICVMLPLDISQLAFAVVGALVFSLLQSSQSSKQKKFAPCKRACSVPTSKSSGFSQWNDRSRSITRPPPANIPAVRDAVKRPSASPVQAPKFESSTWDMQVSELLQQITPSADDDKIVAKIACLVKQVIKPIFPEVEVVGFTSGDLARKKAFAVAVPDVDIVANVNPAILADQLTARLGPFHGATDPKKLQKSAIRLCTDKLVSDAGFKFRRSAFRGEEPKVTLLVPVSCGLGIDAIPINFSVNAVTPLHNAALLTECGLLDNRARELILLVKRWAKDRGICHAAKGHLSPYAWTLLCIFFLQAGMPGNESLLPTLSGFKKASCLMRRDAANVSVAVPTGSNREISEIFCDFMKFYHEIVDWKTEAISIRTGKRGEPALSLQLHIIVDERTKATVVGPSVEDPFEANHNLADAMTGTSFSRLQEELCRAHKLCSSGKCSLAELLEPWAPADIAEHTSERNMDETDKATATKKPVAVVPWRKQAVVRTRFG